jgi:hypothetical protein
VPLDHFEVPEHPLAMLDLAPGQAPRGIASIKMEPVEAGGMGFQPVIIW